MIVVKMEMWRGGNPDDTYPLGSAHIWNVGGSYKVGEYKFKLFDKAGREYKQGEVKGLPRLRLLVWDLLFRVLKFTHGDRN